MHESWIMLVPAIRTTSDTAPTLRTRTLSLPARSDPSTQYSRLKSQKGVPVHTHILYNLVYPSPVSTRWKWGVNRRSRKVNDLWTVALALRAPDTCAKTSSIRVVVLAVGRYAVEVGR